MSVTQSIKLNLASTLTKVYLNIRSGLMVKTVAIDTPITSNPHLYVQVWWVNIIFRINTKVGSHTLNQYGQEKHFYFVICIIDYTFRDNFYSFLLGDVFRKCCLSHLHFTAGYILYYCV